MNDVERPGENDVICGRGAGTTRHSGNIRWREMIAEVTEEHKQLRRRCSKCQMVKDVVQQIRGLTPPGRFLKLNKITWKWEDIGDEQAMAKTAQAFRDARRIDQVETVDARDLGLTKKQDTPQLHPWGVFRETHMCAQDLAPIRESPLSFQVEEQFPEYPWGRSESAPKKHAIRLLYHGEPDVEMVENY